MCTNMMLAAVQNRILRNAALERWLELPPKVSKDAKDAQLKGPSPWPPALVSLGLSLDRPRSALLGTPQINKKTQSVVQPSPQGQLKNVAPLVPALVEAPRLENLLPSANAQFAVRRARRSQFSAGDA